MMLWNVFIVTNNDNFHVNPSPGSSRNKYIRLNDLQDISHDGSKMSVSCYFVLKKTALIVKKLAVFLDRSPEDVLKL